MLVDPRPGLLTLGRFCHQRAAVQSTVPRASSADKPRDAHRQAGVHGQLAAGRDAFRPVLPAAVFPGPRHALVPAPPKVPRPNGEIIYELGP